MMAVLTSSGVWLLLMLIGAIFGYPTKNALDPRRRYDELSPGSNWRAPPSGLAQAESEPPAHSNPAFPPAPDEQQIYFQPNAQMKPVPAPSGGDMYSAPVYSEHEGHPSYSTQSRVQAPPYEVTWAIPPPSPFIQSAPGKTGFASNLQPPGPRYESPPGPFLPPLQPGDMSYEEKIYEHGNSDSESEARMPPLPPPPPQYLPVPALNGLPINSPLALVAILDRFRSGYPNIDYMLLTRQYPSGTYTLSGNSFDHGKNQWHDTYNVGSPVRPNKQLNPFFGPRSPKQPGQPVQQNIRHARYGTRDVVTA